MTLKHSVYTVCLPELEPEVAVQEIRQTGYEGVEWRVYDSTLPPPEPAWFLRDNRCTLDLDETAGARAAELCRAEGLAIVGLSPYIDTGDTAMVDKAMRMAVSCGAPQIRIRGALMDGTPHATLVERTLDFFDDVQKLALSYEVKAAVEIHHGTICPSASATRAILDRFDPAAVGAIMDVGNMAVEGYEDYRIAIPVLGPYLTHVHLKNAAWQRREPGQPWSWYWSALDDGVVNVAGLLTALEDAGYDGWISQEDFSDRESSAELIRKNRHYLARLDAGSKQ